MEVYSLSYIMIQAPNVKDLFSKVFTLSPLTHHIKMKTGVFLVVCDPLMNEL